MNYFYLKLSYGQYARIFFQQDINYVIFRGIRFVSKDRVARMTAIAEELATGKYDFVFLQEVWTTEDYERIKSRTGDVLPYSHYFFSGVIGAGICIFSKSPIRSAFFHQWAVNGYIHKVC